MQAAAAEAEVTVRATISRIRYRSGDGTFAIAILTDGIAIKGPIAHILLDTEYELTGTWEEHSQWGRQFKVSSCQMIYPTDLDGIARYLRNNIKWLGPVRSRQLLEVFGEQALETLRDKPELVAEKINGVTLEKATEIAAEMNENKKRERLLVELEGLFAGTLIHAGILQRIADEWKEAAPARIRKNPYSLIGVFRGVGFLVADSVALKIGIKLDDPFRLRAGILHTMQQHSLEGHVCFPRLFVTSMAASLLKVIQQKTVPILDALLVEERSPIVQENGWVYFNQAHEDEHYIAEKLHGLLSYTFDPVEPDTTELYPDQAAALTAVAAGVGVFILTGAPGTGKTFTSERIISTFNGLQVLQVAPTGKAAKRLEEQSGQHASTIHRALKPLPSALTGGTFEFQMNQDNPLHADIVVCDEASMLDNWLFAELLRATSLGTRLILIGDIHQLPSVGPGNILKDLIAAGIPSVELDQIKRQDAGLIIRNCFAIKNGRDIETPCDPDLDFMFIPRPDEQKIQSAILSLIQRLPKSQPLLERLERTELDPLNDIQVIVPRRAQVALSCEKLNPVIQELLVGKPEKGYFQPGDKVIQTWNDYTHEIMNGDIGRVLSIAGGKISVRFDNPVRTVNLPVKENSLELAYAITCHKFQGSEAEVVIIPIHKSGGAMVQQRNWIYTGISRAKKLCILVGDRAEITKIIYRKSQQIRYTRLKELLVKMREA